MQCSIHYDILRSSPFSPLAAKRLERPRMDGEAVPCDDLFIVVLIRAVQKARLLELFERRDALPKKPEVPDYVFEIQRIVLSLFEAADREHFPPQAQRGVFCSQLADCWAMVPDA
uniref:Uncharacterized protein n=1 Tax=Globodera pallida TaxID=36090 RepID=A0A183BUP9_GLOPA